MVDKGNRLKALLGGKSEENKGLQSSVVTSEIKKVEEKAEGLNSNKTPKHQTFLLDIDELNKFRLKVMEHNIKNPSKRISQSEFIRMFIDFVNRKGIEETIKTMHDNRY